LYRIKNTTEFNGKQIFGTEEVTRVTEAEAVEQGYTVVKTAQELKAALQPGDASCKVMLFADINLDDLGVDETGSNWTAVGTTSSDSSDSFKGTFDGNGFTISNLKINKPESDYQGLFGCTNGAEIKNVNLDNVDIIGKTRIGGLVGYTYNTNVSDCKVSGIINGGESRIGGLIGVTEKSSIENCCSFANVTGEEFYIGGLVGRNNKSSITNSDSKANVTGKNSTGGLVGYNDASSTVEQCSSSANVIGSGIYIGGLVGYNYSNSTVKNSTTTAVVYGESSHVGGLVGYNYSNSKVEYCSSFATVTGDGDFVGGLVGRSESSSVSYSESAAMVTGNARWNGGLVGYNYKSTINNCVSTSTVKGYSRTGGLVGINYYNSTITDCYSSSVVTGTDLYTGGLVGRNSTSAKIINCESNDIVIGTGYTGGLVGYNHSSCIIENCSAHSTVTGTDDFIGGLVGVNESSSQVIKSSSTSNVSGTGVKGAFIGKYASGTLNENKYNGQNTVGLSAVGTGLDNPSDSQIYNDENLVINKNIPQIVIPETDGKSVTFNLQVGIKDDDHSTISVDTGLNFGLFNVNISTEYGARAAIDKIDKLISKIYTKQTELGAVSNRLSSAIEFQNTQIKSTSAAMSLIQDADMAEESSKYIKSKILQDTTSSLLSTANQSPEIALRLLNVKKQ
ncbi:hypothetical protein IKE67_07410, partial [bacterium]|nr:hypothetical protein [bacterium]